MAAITAPVPNTAIDNGFRPTGPNSHTGVDYPVAVGAPIYSPCDGTVEAVGSGSHWGALDLGWDYGRWVVIHDGNGNDNHLAHFGTIQVTKGQKVTRGQQIGLGGRSGAESGPHCHWAVYSPFPVRSTLINPVTYLAQHPNTEPVNVGPVTPATDTKEITLMATIRNFIPTTSGTNANPKISLGKGQFYTFADVGGHIAIMSDTAAQTTARTLYGAPVTDQPAAFWIEAAKVAKAASGL